ncbi:MAG: hypothetical protein KDA61_22630, partial [Planctomycetales bacterium]|nr:hypothetical protein [Planctomycetales bacterium]
MLTRNCNLNTLMALVATLNLAAPVQAIQINLNYADNGENPSYDQNGLLLQELAFAAKTIWETLLPEPGEYDWDLYWGDLDNGSLGKFEITGTAALDNVVLDPTPRGFNGEDLSWYIDPTPADHSEFDFFTQMQENPAQGYVQGTTLYKDLAANPASAWFNVSPPPAVLEIGYIGSPIVTLPASSVVSPAPSEIYDLLSVMLHEMGHGLGINSA